MSTKGPFANPVVWVVWLRDNPSCATPTRERHRSAFDASQEGARLLQAEPGQVGARAVPSGKDIDVNDVLQRLGCAGEAMQLRRRAEALRALAGDVAE